MKLRIREVRPLRTLVGFVLASSITTCFFTQSGEARMEARRNIVAVGPLCIDGIVKPLGPPVGEKPPCEITLEPGGAGYNVIAATQPFGVATRLVALHGDDHLATLATRMARRAIPECVPVPAMDRTRISVLLDGRCYTARHPVTRPLTAECEEAIRAADLVVLAPLLGQDHDFAAHILGMSRWSLLLLSSDQLADREKALDLMRRAGLTQLNEAEARQLTGEDDPISMTQWLRSEGVGDVLITTRSGVLSFIEGDWSWQPAFAVTPRRPGDTPKTGDTFAGAVLAARAMGHGWGESIRLGAAAAAVLVAEGRLPAVGLTELREFSERGATQPPPTWLRPTVQVSHLRQVLYAGTGVAAAAALYLLLPILNLAFALN